MTATVLRPAGNRQRTWRAWLLWSVSLALVLGVHAGFLLLLRRTIPAMGPVAPEAIMLDLAPEPTAPEPAPEAPPPPEPPPPQPTPAPEPLPPPEPEPVVPPIEEVAPPMPKAEVTLPPARPPVLRPRPAVVRPVTPPPSEAPPPVLQAAPPGPAMGAPPGQVEATWEGRLVAHLARFKRFPPAAQRRGEQGVVLMRLTVARAGAVLAMSVARGSGYADLDEEAQAWLTRAQPLPAFPPEIITQQMEILVPLRFTLR